MVMQAIARLRAAGVPVLRWHSDRAKEYSSHQLSAWLSAQGICATKSAPEDHPANSRAEVTVRGIKHAARRCLLVAGVFFCVLVVSGEASRCAILETSHVLVGCPRT